MTRPKIRHHSRFALSLLLLSVLAATGCSSSNPSSPQQSASPQPPVGTQNTESPRVVATFLPIYWFTSAVAGDKAQIEVLVPPGSEVHEYQATPANVQAIAQADVLVKNGLGLEEFLQETIKNSGNAQLKEIDSSKGMNALEDASPVVNGQDATSEEDHNHAEANPHVWLDPVRAKQQVENIRDGLIAANPENKATYQANATAYIQQLEALDKEFQQRLQPYRGCTYVTFHDAYPYIAQRYQLKQVAVVQIPEDNLSPADIQKAVGAVKKYNVKALLGEPGTDNKLLKSLSTDLKLTLRTIDPLENGPLNPEHYFTAMKQNLQTLEAACK
ncbi:metal ABC transporter solute-binding protein, Zn/Mn family [Coleofasciculus sp. H7-2]|uniref:metal ABC transporter solute-binding protein, Zn/Mn family n=1 Tax=Coleofasciculus sp. H7-2 TaxID=3351545 RepID=UPI0036733561